MNEFTRLAIGSVHEILGVKSPVMHDLTNCAKQCADLHQYHLMLGEEPFAENVQRALDDAAAWAWAWVEKFFPDLEAVLDYSHRVLVVDAMTFVMASLDEYEADEHIELVEKFREQESLVIGLHLFKLIDDDVRDRWLRQISNMACRVSPRLSRDARDAAYTYTQIYCPYTLEDQVMDTLSLTSPKRMADNKRIGLSPLA